jgi:hypothetical protein
MKFTYFATAIRTFDDKLNIQLPAVALVCVI